MIKTRSNMFHLAKFSCTLNLGRKEKAKYLCHQSWAAAVANTHFPWALARPLVACTCSRKVYSQNSATKHLHEQCHTDKVMAATLVVEWACHLGCLLRLFTAAPPFFIISTRMVNENYLWVCIIWHDVNHRGVQLSSVQWIMAGHVLWRRSAFGLSLVRVMMALHITRTAAEQIIMTDLYAICCTGTFVGSYHCVCLHVARYPASLHSCCNGNLSRPHCELWSAVGVFTRIYYNTFGSKAACKLGLSMKPKPRCR